MLFMKYLENEKETSGEAMDDEDDSDSDSGDNGKHLTVSCSTISRYLLHGGMEAHGYPSITFKVASWCSSKGQRVKLKAQWIDVALKKLTYFYKGIEIFFTDKSHWETWSRTVCSWSAKGQKAYLYLFSSENMFHYGLSNVFTWKLLHTHCEEDGESKSVWGIC